MEPIVSSVEARPAEFGGFHGVFSDPSGIRCGPISRGRAWLGGGLG